MKKFAFITLLLTSLSASQSISVLPDPPDGSETLSDYNIDHLIVAINDLDKGIEMFEAMTGIRPVAGGEHPGRGTHNALVSLGENTYMEIIAPRSKLDSAEYEMSKHLRDYEELTPVGWAVTTTDASEAKELVSELDFSVSDLRAGSRKKPNGKILSWVTFGITERLAAFPFFIQWGKDSEHPSSTSPAGIELKSVMIVTPDSERLSKLVNELNLDVEVVDGEVPFMEILLETEKGEVVISGQ